MGVTADLIHLFHLIYKMQYTVDTALWRGYRTLSNAVRKAFSVRYIIRLFLLACVLSVVWYAMMFLMAWYSPGFHLAATFVSTGMVATGNSWGVLSSIIEPTPQK